MAKNIISEALASIDADIAALQRAKDIIIAASTSADQIDAAPKPRKPRNKRGMPATDAEALKF